ncbi:unnamed protein product, partial [Scytosiphon promiscuus]
MNQKCMADCSGYEYFGTQHGEECWCGTSSDDYDQHGEADDSECSMSCSGDASETCGAGWRMSLYSMSGEGTPTPTPPTPSPVTPTPPSPTPTPPTTGDGATYVGCFVDKAEPERVFGESSVSEEMTIAVSHGIGSGI